MQSAFHLYTITKESKKTKHLLEEYNATSSQLTDDYVPVSLSEVFSTTSDFWQSLAPNAHRSSSVPWNTQRDIVQASLIIRRSNEELKLLEQEMGNVISYWKRQRECITTQLQHMENADADVQFNKGARCLLTKQLLKAELFYKRAVSSFSKVIVIPDPMSSDNNPMDVFDDDNDVDDKDDEDDEDDDDDVHYSTNYIKSSKV